MAKIADFVGKVRDGGLAKTSQFAVILNLPFLLNKSPYVEKREKILMFCDRAVLPSVNMNTAQVRSYGEFKEVPYEKIYEPASFSFYVDNAMIVKSLFDDWMNLIQDSKTRDFKYPRDYMTDTIDVIVQDSQDRTTYTVTLKECFLKTVSPIQLDYAAKDIMKIDVTISYKYYMYNAKRGLDLNRKDTIRENVQEVVYGQTLQRQTERFRSDIYSHINDYSKNYTTIDGARSGYLGVGLMQDVLKVR